MQNPSFGKFFLFLFLNSLYSSRNNFDSQALAPVRRPASPTHFDFDESTDVMALQPELKAIAREIAENSQHTPMNEVAQTSGTDQVFLTVKWQPHPMDQHGEARESQYKMDRVSLQAQESVYHAHFIDRVKTSVNSLRPPQTMQTSWLKNSS